MEKAKEISENPKPRLKKHQQYFANIEGEKVANLCGSNGRKAVPLALLGADVTVFDISAEKKYALELAKCANASIGFIVGDIYDINLNDYADHFDILYLEGGILHYFNDIDKFMEILYSILKNGGRMVLSDFHPLRRCIGPDFNILYKYTDEKEQKDFPDVAIKSYTLSEI
ncbi:class I SAM-dependent methyltransferase [Lederbergia galactosidilytica]|uniref:class I SAM-dependent methyltransferase n=1 Tax=Lederbergia galactosidilytica TaxID=217031 RepID=UPI000AFE6638|nr:class I SAM-dependent methyltransferase [Lederbergia galactosidilytica]